MADGKARRQRTIAELIATRSITSQEELAEQLSAAGFRVTQATISRDLNELGATKVRSDAGLAYALTEESGGAGQPHRRLAAILREWVRSVATAGNLVVLKTPPGSAHLVGVALDRAALDRVVGTICGDDTIFIAVADAESAASTARELDRLRAF